MKPSVYIVDGRLIGLQDAYRNLNKLPESHKATIYPMKRRYRMMVVGFFDIIQLSTVINDSSLKIAQHENH